MTAPRRPTSDDRANDAWQAARARDALLWPATIGTLLSLALAAGAVAVAPGEWAKWGVGLAAVVGVLVITAVGARAALRWARDAAADSAATLAEQVRWSAPGRPDTTSLPATLRIPLERAMRLAVADARAHAARSADAGHAALGVNVAVRLEALATRLGDADASTHPTAADVRSELAALATALRSTGTAPPSPDATPDVAALVVSAVDEARRAGAAIRLQHDGAHAPVRLHAPSFHEAVANALRAATGDAAPGAVVVDLRRTRRADYEEHPVRRAHDSPRTIVPRAPQSVARTWIAEALPPAELLSLVIADPARPLPPEERTVALAPFAPPRPADPLGLVIAELRRAVERAGGCLWLDDAREGGTAIHVLLPIATP